MIYLLIIILFSGPTFF